ncbi:hypothetical protein ES702_01243 [subsurface metagenome]
MNKKAKIGIYSVIGLLVLVGIFSLCFVFAGEGWEEPVRYTPPYTIGEKCYSSYDSVNKIMTDTSCLQFKTETNGVITINNERYLAFALKGIIDGNEIIRTSMDFTWTWHIEEDNGDYIFWAENDNPNFIWRQYYYFYEDYSKPMKIEHYLENNLNDITDMQMYYLTNVLPTDEIEYNETRYLVSDYMGLHKQGDFNELISTLNFNSEYDFRFEDLIDDGFTINEFYIGSGSVIDKPNIDITAIGFTKNNGNFPKGSSVWIDPTFTTEDIESLDLTVLDSDTFVVAWCDESSNHIEFLIYDTDGTPKISQVTVDSFVGSCVYTSVSVSALNSTDFVIGWFDDADDDITVAIYDSSGTLKVGPVDVDTTASGSANSVSVSAFNETTFVIGWFDDGEDDVSFRIYDYSLDNLTNILDADQSAGTYCWAVSVSTFNETTFVIGWHDDGDGSYDFSIYDVSGNLLTGPITASAAGDSVSVSVSTFNETTFVIGWHDKAEEDVTYSIYDISGNLLIGPIDADTTVPEYSGRDYVSVSALNSTHFVIGWFDVSEGDNTFSINDTSGTWAGIGPIDSSLTTEGYSAVSSYLSAVDIGLSDIDLNPLFVHAFTITSSLSNFTVYNADGTVYEPPVVDETPPTYSNAQTNTTIAGTLCNFSITYDDDTALESNGQWIFSTNNTGVWVNESAVNFTSTPETISVIKTLNSTVGLVIGYRWYANDSAGNNNNTVIYTLTTTSDICSPTVNEDWSISDAQVCNGVATTTGTGSIIILSGGTLHLLNGANITTTKLELRTTGDQVFVSSKSELIIG